VPFAATSTLASIPQLPRHSASGIPARLLAVSLGPAAGRVTVVVIRGALAGRRFEVEATGQIAGKGGPLLRLERPGATGHTALYTRAGYPTHPRCRTGTRWPI
jgi:hypothetical protein